MGCSEMETQLRFWNANPDLAAFLFRCRNRDSSLVPQFPSLLYITVTLNGIDALMNSSDGRTGWYSPLIWTAILSPNLAEFQGGEGEPGRGRTIGGDRSSPVGSTVNTCTE